MSTLLSKKFKEEPKHVETDILHSGNEYCKEMLIPQGHLVPTHSHKYDHISILATGKVIVECEGVKKGYIGPTKMIIKKNVSHRILALEDSVWYCIHGTTEHNLALIDETLVDD